MNWHKRLRDALDRKVTVLIIPQTPLKPWRLQFSNAFFLVLASLWTGLTIWAGFVVGRHTDYWITKADNQVMMAKLGNLAQEMQRSREVLDMAAATDQQLRVLLSLSRRRDIVQNETAVGGPTPADRSLLKKMLDGGASGVNQADWHKQIAAIRAESYKRLASFQEITWYISNQRSLYHATPNMWPTEGQITSLFGYRFDPIRREEGESGEFHAGIDIANSPDTLIYATADGTVRHTGWSHGYGQMVVIDHGYGISTLYGHTSKFLVQNGQRVSRGQVIAYMGTTGRSTGAHLHYEVWRHGKPVNPMIFLKLRSGSDFLSARPATAPASGR
ncbi:MAG: M23 family metallopeptidase [Elusimicrobia bacterium]|nr:M23 family metallopeptidase [Elusimicrobiota bacterium]